VSESILWYDLETFGLEPALDRVAQFACRRTTPELEDIPGDDPVTLYCAPPPDYLPDPKACLVSGIGPESCRERGTNEYAFMRRVNRLMSVPGNCSAGFNSIRFDDEFIRHGLYRNLLDPYEREWRDGNSRFDLLDVLRAAGDLRPEGLVWPRDAEGKPVFRLEALSAANGIEHADAHDAAGDVRVTIELARRLRAAQPRFFDWCWRHRLKDKVRQLVNPNRREPFVHTSSMLSGPQGATSVLLPLIPQPGNPNCILCYDLRHDPEELIALPPEAVRLRLFSRNEELEARGESRIHIKGVHLNRAPFVAPLSIIQEGETKGGPPLAARLGIDLAACRRHAERLSADSRLTQKILAVYQRDEPDRDRDPELRLYEGFISDHDRTYLEALRYEADADRAPAESGRAILELLPRLNFNDRKYAELAWRFACRNFPEALDAAELARWHSFCAGRLLMPPGGRLANRDFYRRKIEEHLADTSLPAAKKPVLKDLADWGARLDREILGLAGSGPADPPRDYQPPA
jgi:exodeoxyribonuclease-1